jgi:predicted RNase H-like nuclease
MTAWVAGTDGCRRGWVVSLRRKGSLEPVIRVVDTMSDVLLWNEPLEVLGIDIPIGLPERAEKGGRECDQAARRLLGQPRGRSVFSPPARPALAARTFDEALALNRKTAKSTPGTGLSRQCFNLFPKIREVDRFVTQSLPMEVVEVHPELAFYELSGGRPLTESKKSPHGLELRIELLEESLGCELSPLVEEHRSSKVARDDIVDAMAVCWTAERALEGIAIRLPSTPPRDSRGLRMQIVR